VFDPHHHAAAVDIADFQHRDFRNPQARAQAVVSATRAFRLDTDSRNATTSSPLSTVGSFRGARA